MSVDRCSPSPTFNKSRYATAKPGAQDDITGGKSPRSRPRPRRHYAKKEGLTNITVIEGGAASTNLPNEWARA